MANQNSSSQGNKNSSGGSSKKSIHDARPTKTKDISSDTTRKS